MYVVAQRAFLLFSAKELVMNDWIGWRTGMINTKHDA
jgi:hypothetical protein